MNYTQLRELGDEMNQLESNQVESKTLQQETAHKSYLKEESGLDFYVWYEYWCFEQELYNDLR